MKKSFFIIIVLGLFAGAHSVQGWWIFGRSRGEVELRFLQINNVRFDEADGAVTLPREYLDNGRAVIRGRARAGRAQMGAVEVSTDNQENWHQANMADDGTFEFSWRPEMGEEYTVFIKATTTAGQSNRVDDTRLEVRLTERDMRGMIVESLENLASAYQNQDINAFMRGVSRDFAGDNIILDRAVRNDFSLFENIDINFNLNNMAIARDGRIVVNITFNRSLVSSRTGEPFSDRGRTDFTFVQEGGDARLWAMRAPLLFGLSDASQVATGSTRQAGDEEMLLVTESGEVTTARAIELERQAEDEMVSVVSTGDIVLQHEEGFNFAGETKVTSENQADIFYGYWDRVHHLFFDERPGGIGQRLGPGSVENINEAPSGGYNMGGTHVHIDIGTGEVYAVRTSEGNYAVIEIVSVGRGNMRIRYVYQPDGSRFF